MFVLVAELKGVLGEELPINYRRIFLFIEKRELIKLKKYKHN